MKSRLEALMKAYGAAKAEEYSTGFGDLDHITQYGNLYLILK